MSSKELTKTAIRYLLTDAISHIDMLEPLRREAADILYAGQDGVIIYERKSQACMISMQDSEKYKSVVDFAQYDLFAVHQRNIAEWIQQKGKYSHCFEVYQAVYGEKEPIADCFDSIRVLSHDYTDQVCRNYETMDDRKYIEDLIGKKRMWGIFDNGTLAGFIGEHSEGSIGLLEVLPEYRRKGYGYKLEAFLINRFLQLGETPFCQVKTDNAKSLALQRKIGMDISGRTTTWIYD